jgi:hypothetical protein
MMPSGSGEAVLDKHPNRVVSAVLAAVFVTLLGMVLNGYRFGIWDHSFYLPMIERAADPSLLRNDYLLTGPQEQYTFWVPLMAAAARRVPLPYVCFAGYVAAQVGLFTIIFLMSLALFRSPVAALLTLLMLVLPKEVGYTRTFTHDFYFTIRTTAMPLVYGAVLSIGTGRVVLASALSAVAFLIHPITALPAVVIVAAEILTGPSARKIRSAMVASAIFIAVAAPLLLRVMTMPRDPGAGRLFAIADPEWLAIVQGRSDDSLWSAYVSMAVFLAVLLTLMAIRRFGARATPVSDPLSAHGRPMNDRFILRATMTVGLLLLLERVFTDIVPIAIIVQFCLSRSYHFVITFAALYAGWFVWDQARTYRSALAAARGVFPVLAVHAIHGLVPLTLIYCFLSRSPERLLLAPIALAIWAVVPRPDKLTPLRLSSARIGAIIALAGALLAIARYRGLFFTHEGIAEAVDAALFLSLLTILAAIRVVEDAVTLWNGRWRLLSSASAIAVSLILILLTNEYAVKKAMSPTTLGERIQLPFLAFQSDWRVGQGNLPYNDWFDVGIWCRQHTPSDAVFLVPPSITEFRVFSKRAIVGDLGDGAPVLFSKQLAVVWRERMAALDGYDRFTADDFLRVGRRYGATYVIVTKFQGLALPLRYQNQSFRVYELPPAGGQLSHQNGEPRVKSVFSPSVEEMPYRRAGR